MKIRTLLAAALALGIGYAGPAITTASAQTAAAPKKITFLTNYVFHGRHSPFFVGLEKGYYKEAGFDISIQPATGSGFVVTAVDSGKADYGMADTGSMVQGIAKGSKVKGFMVFMDVSTSGLASFEPYPTLQSLKGKKVAAGQTDSARVTMPILLDKAKLPADWFEWVTSDPGVYSSLLLSGQVDLFTASIDGDVPALEKVAGPRGKKVFFTPFSDWGYDVYGYLLVASADSLAKDPDGAKRFAQATRKAVQYSIANPDEAAKIMVKHNPTLNPETTLAQWKQSIKAIDTAYVKKNGYGVATPERLQTNLDFLARSMKLDTKLTGPDIYSAALTGP
jgi:NitT/TauT family transport system substrate-binding protein